MELTFRAGEPLYTQLRDDLTLAVASGDYGPGQRLPAVRELAAEAGVNPNTVQRALSELERDGLVFSRRTLGRFVTEDTERIEAVRQRIAEEKAKEFLDTMARLDFNRIQTVLLLEKLRGAAEQG